MLLGMSFCSKHVWAIERPAPVFPEASTLESGNYYYLYNVGGDRWLGNSTTSSGYAGAVEYSSAMCFLLEHHGVTSNKIVYEGYSLKTSNNYYLTSSGTTNLRTNNYSSLNSYGYWTFAETEGGYTFQRAPYNSSYYNADQFVGWNDDTSDMVYPNQTEGNIVWKLIAQDEFLRYKHKMGLYEALQLADIKGWPYFTYKKYDDIYNNEGSLTAEIQNAKDELNRMIKYNSSEYFVNSSAADAPMVFGSDYGWYYATGWYYSTAYTKTNSIYASIPAGSAQSITAYVKVDKNATFSGSFSYKIYDSWSGSAIDYLSSYCERNLMRMEVYVDGQLVRTLDNKRQIGQQTTWGNSPRYFNELEPGEHTIEWRFTNTSPSTTIYVHPYTFNVHYTDTPISVSLLEPGSLGTEVLYNVDYIKDVRCLKVKGKMNDEDWAKIGMMTNLNTLDLSEAKIDSIPTKALSGMAWLHKLTLPEGLKRIGYSSLSYLPLEELTIPSTVETIENFAINNCQQIKTLAIPASVKTVKNAALDYMYALEHVDWQADADIPTYAFYNDFNLRTVDITGNPKLIDNYAFEYCFSLENVNFANSITSIGKYAFERDYNLVCRSLPANLEAISDYAFQKCTALPVVLPNKLKTIGQYAFYECDSLGTQDNGAFVVPEKVTSIGNYAFRYCDGIELLTIKNAQTIGDYAFNSCSKLRSLELPTAYYSIGKQYTFTDCNNISEITLRSPSVVLHDNSLVSSLSKVTLKVPSFAVSNYKLDEYWYNAKEIIGFGTGEVSDWYIYRPVTLNHERMEGTPNVYLYGGTLKVNGELPVGVKKLHIGGGSLFVNGDAPLSVDNITISSGNIVCNGNNSSVSGKIERLWYFSAKTWSFLSLPFDIKISDITFSAENVQYAIRYYDGASRAASGTGGNWKNYNKEEDVIPAGTGFIMQTNIATDATFYAIDNGSKQQCVSNKEFVKTLAVNASEKASNHGWNLVGNPWQSYFNDHMLNFTGPITVWNTSNKTYTAYSVTDDDYAIRPNEAFFVQCPNEEYNTIGFPTQGRQLTSVIESQNAVKAQVPVARTRQIVNLTISNGEMEDRTRVVLNEKASMSYETACDASKFMSMDNSVPQLYTLDEQGNTYAINERPTGDGTVLLGFYAGAAGEYTISVARCDAEQVFLTDFLTGQTKDITNDSYNFSADMGTDNGRFCLSFVSNEETAIEGVEQLSNAHIEVFGLDGKYLGHDASKLKTGVYVIRQGKKVTKVTVR